MILNLQSLRGICALLIIIHHFGFSAMEALGVWSVSLFAMLSGFVLSKAFAPRVEDRLLPSVGSFMKKRIARVYPLYFLGMLWALMLMKFHTSPGIIVANILMIQSWIPDQDVYYAVNAPAWFVSGLIIRYVLFIPALVMMVSCFKRFCTVSALLFIAYFAISIFIPGGLIEPIIYVFPLMQIPVFALGMIGFRMLYMRKSFPSLNATLANIATVAVVGMLAALIVAYPDVSARFTSSSYWWIATLLLIILLTIVDSSRCLISRFLHLRPMLLLGKISYPLFILHVPFITTYRIILGKLSVELPMAVDLVVCLALMVPFCIAASRITRIFYKPQKS